ncbi:MAG: hypothetical protein SH817_07385 [Leptospira sp.]|nr:hypothetical protein [Leptospira sp.]
MKKRNQILFWLNLFLLITYGFLQDPFSFFPKSYEDAPKFIKANIDQIKKLEITNVSGSKQNKISIWREGFAWYLKSEDDSIQKIPDRVKLFQFLTILDYIHKFEFDKMRIDEKMFWGESQWTLSIYIEDENAITLQFGKCLQLNTECLVKEIDSNSVYPIPYSIINELKKISEFEILTLSPFSNLNENSIERIEYSQDGIVKYSLWKEEEKWFTYPELNGEVNPKRIREFILRLTSWSGDMAVKNSVSYKENNFPQSQSLTVHYKNANAETKIMTVYDIGGIPGGKKAIYIKPFDQTIQVSYYAWEYWKFFDLKQLLMTTE